MSEAPQQIDFGALAKLALSQGESLLSQWFPAGKCHGREFKVGNLAGDAGESLSINLDDGRWADFAGDKKGGDLTSLYAAKHGIKQGEAARKLAAELGQPIINRSETSRRREVAAYDYTNAAGELLYQVVRYEPKDFRQRRPDGAGGWLWKMKDVRLVLYRLPEVIKAVEAGRVIYINEGEKGANAVAALGLPATCSPGGAGKWRKDYGRVLKGANVVIIEDNDEAGRKHTADVATKLSGIAAQVQVLRLPGLGEKGDVADWIAKGGTREELERLAADAPLAVEQPAPEEAPTAADLGEYAANEDGIALAFAKRHGDDLRYDHDVGAWYRWNGTIWRKDRTKLAFSWARKLCRDIAQQGGDQEKQEKLAKASTSAAVERFAQADRIFAVTAEIWDSDDWLLGTPGGTVDLRTGELLPARRDAHISKATSVAPADVPECRLWLKFLGEITGEDQGLIRFLRQWCGYCLTGSTREQALLFGEGDGGNGKGVFLNTIAGILGDYCVNAAMDTFHASQHDKHSTDLAMLAGARMVIASETEEGRAWAEARIKALTGGDKITARFMRQDNFEFLPRFKLTVIGNHKPILKNVDEAAKRRLNIVPFHYKPPKKDPTLSDKLKAERPEILRWMIEGCLDWQKNGLVRPAIVMKATEEYFESQDHFSRWLIECCDLGATFEMKPAQLLQSFQHWCQANGEEASDNKRLRGMLERTPGIRYVTVNGSQKVRGIALKPPTGGNARYGEHE